MKKWLPALVLLCAVVLEVRLYHNTPKSAQPPAGSSLEKNALQNAAVSNALAKQDSNIVGAIQSNFALVQPPPENRDAAPSMDSPGRAGPPSPLEFTNVAPSLVLDNMRAAVRQFGETFGGNPIGNNSEITAALNGNNSKHINFINAEAGMRINARGELVDPWGTPYFFHQISGTEMEIHSAGPDKTLGTDDDLIAQ